MQIKRFFDAHGGVATFGLPAVVTLAMSSPPRHEVIAFFVDDDGCGRGVITAVRNAADPDAVIGVAEIMALHALWVRDEAGPLPTGLVLASARRWRSCSRVTRTRNRRWCRSDASSAASTCRTA